MIHCDIINIRMTQQFSSQSYSSTTIFKRFILGSITLIFLSSHTTRVFATTLDFNSLSEYSVQSVPEAQHDTMRPIDQKDDTVQLKSSTNDSLASLTYAQKETQPSFLEKMGLAVDSVRNSISNFTTSTGKVLSVVKDTVIDNVEKHGMNVLFGADVLIFSTTAGLVLFPAVITSNDLIQDFFKSGIDLEVRAAVGIASLYAFFQTGNGLSGTYQDKIAGFQNVTNWDVGSIGRDLTIILVPVALVTALVAGGTILTAAKSFFLTAIAYLPTSRVVGKYIVSETKDAFIETEKECSERDDKCASNFDKGTIMLFNYLPDKMPDMGMDDFIIDLKNSFFKKTNTEASK